MCDKCDRRLERIADHIAEHTGAFETARGVELGGALGWLKISAPSCSALAQKG
jgi:hypothetical protein